MKDILALVVPEKSPFTTFHSLNVFELLSSGYATISTCVPGVTPLNISLILSVGASVTSAFPNLYITGNRLLLPTTVISNVFTLKPKLFVATGKSAPAACLCAGVSVLPNGLGTI